MKEVRRVVTLVGRVLTERWWVGGSRVLAMLCAAKRDLITQVQVRMSIKVLHFRSVHFSIATLYFR